MWCHPWENGALKLKFFEVWTARNGLCRTWTAVFYQHQKFERCGEIHAAWSALLRLHMTCQGLPHRQGKGFQYNG